MPAFLAEIIPMAGAFAFIFSILICCIANVLAESVEDEYATGMQLRTPWSIILRIEN